MTETMILKGRLTGPTTVELDRPVSRPVAGEIEVKVPVVAEEPAAKYANLLKHLRSLPTGSRTLEDVMRQIHEERSSWE
jgi:hypothetical protein